VFHQKAALAAFLFFAATIVGAALAAIATPFIGRSIAAKAAPTKTCCIRMTDYFSNELFGLNSSDTSLHSKS
jgi:hypothetical protein